jgi:hypothetical protein
LTIFLWAIISPINLPLHFSIPVRIEISLPAISLWRGTKVEKIARLGSASRLVMSGRVVPGEEAGGELPALREGYNKLVLGKYWRAAFILDYFISNFK